MRWGGSQCHKYLLVTYCQVLWRILWGNQKLKKEMFESEVWKEWRNGHWDWSTRHTTVLFLNFYKKWSYFSLLFFLQPHITTIKVNINIGYTLPFSRQIRVLLVQAKKTSIPLNPQIGHSQSSPSFASNRLFLRTWPIKNWPHCHGRMLYLPRPPFTLKRTTTVLLLEVDKKQNQIDIFLFRKNKKRPNFSKDITPANPKASVVVLNTSWSFGNGSFCISKAHTQASSAEYAERVSAESLKLKHVRSLRTFVHCVQRSQERNNYGRTNKLPLP